VCCAWPPYNATLSRYTGSDVMVGSAVVGALVSLALVAVVRAGNWQAGDESAIAAFLLAASFAALASLTTACWALRSRGAGSTAAWLVIVLALGACAITWWTWEIL
jgi:hypothetical protein